MRLQTDGQTDRRTDKVNPVYPPSNFVGRGYNKDIKALVQDCSNSSALAIELLQSCAKPSTSSYQYQKSHCRDKTVSRMSITGILILAKSSRCMIIWKHLNVKKIGTRHSEVNFKITEIRCHNLAICIMYEEQKCLWPRWPVAGTCGCNSGSLVFKFICRIEIAFGWVPQNPTDGKPTSMA